MSGHKSTISNKIKLEESREAVKMTPAERLHRALELSTFALRINSAVRKKKYNGRNRKGPNL